MPLSKKEEKILTSIVVGSENNPNKPEFPPSKPKFPATPTYKIEVPGFSQVWLKDESVNLTGTHKDRMAWEVIILYRDFLLAKKHNQLRGTLPHFSIISSGSAAIAIGTLLKKYHLPKLKVLIDSSLDFEIKKAMKKCHCDIFEVDLSKKPLDAKEILLLTNNVQGFDLTSNRGTGLEIGNYDWMSYEIINNAPDYCFIPFGTGTVYRKVLEINKNEIRAKKHDPRFKGDNKKLRTCNFIGATTNNPKTKAIKLYSPHLPFPLIDEEWIRFYRKAGFCGLDSGVYLLEEKYLDQAMTLVQKQQIDCEYSGIAGLAMMLQMKNKLPKNKKMLIINTGKTKMG